MPYGILAADQIQSSVTGVSLGAGNATRFKNKIINGDFRINQRGFSGTPGSDEYTLDRWFSGRSQASKYTVSQNAGSVTPPAGFINYLGVTSSSAYSVAAGDFFGQAQRIEGLNCADLDFGKSTAKSVTISFWVYSSLTGSFGASISNSAGNRFYPFSYTISSANTWTQASVTIAGDTSGTWLTTNGVGMMLWFSLGMGSNFSGTANTWASSAIYQPTGSTSVVGTNGATFYITGVQLEVGTSATGFEYVDYTNQLLMCQRYYQQFDYSGQLGTANATGFTSSKYSTTDSMVANAQLICAMRTAPTISSTNVSARAVTNTGIVFVTIGGLSSNGMGTICMLFSNNSLTPGVGWIDGVGILKATAEL
jgi:hypothetical protein